VDRRRGTKVKSKADRIAELSPTNNGSGGVQPIWRRDGQEIFFLGADGAVYGVSITRAAGEVRVIDPVKLFAVSVERGGDFNPGFTHQFDVAPGGRRFLVNTLRQQAMAEPPSVVVSWRALEHVR
jgi:hypothetical protein